MSEVEHSFHMLRSHLDFTCELPIFLVHFFAIKRYRVIGLLYFYKLCIY